MERKLDVGETLSEVFDAYREQAGVLLPIAFWLFLLVAVVDGLTGDELALFWVGLVVALAVTTLYQGTVVSLVRDVREGRRDSIGDVIRSALPVVGSLLGAGVLAGIGIGVGMFLLVVPGLYLGTIWAVIAPAIVVERRGVIESFGRSRELVRGNGWPVFWTLVVAYAIAIAATIVFVVLVASFADGPLVRIVLSALASTVTAPITALVASILYFRLREIEGEPDASTTPSPPETAI